jgi:hypothetical protein
MAAVRNHGVAIQVEFEKANFETGFSLHKFKGSNQAVSSYGFNWIQLVQPHHGKADMAPLPPRLNPSSFDEGWQHFSQRSQNTVAVKTLLQSKHGSTDDSRYGPCNKSSDTRE